MKTQAQNSVYHNAPAIVNNFRVWRGNIIHKKEYPYSMPDPFIEQLKRLCREYPIRAKWVVVPAPGIGWTLGERLLQEGCNWLNLRFTTPFQLALDSCAPELLGRGIRPCPDGLGPGLLQNLLLALPEGENRHFRPLIFQPGVARALWDTLCEFRLAGLSSTALVRLTPNPKRLELRRLFQAYEEHLLQAGWADRADVLKTTAPMRWMGAEDLILAYPYCRWSPLEAAYLVRLPGQHLIPEATDHPTPPGWPRRRPRSAGSSPPQFFSAIRRQQELDEIVRRLEEAEVQLDQVEICALPEEALLVRERMARAGYPCTVEAGLPALCSRPGQALRGVLDWIDHGYTAVHLQELFQADLLRPIPNRFRAARLLQSARIAWGRETYEPRLQTLATLYAHRNDDEAAQQCRQLIDWLKRCFRRLPLADNRNQVSVVRWLCGLQEFLSDDFVARGEDDAPARQLLHSSLEELKHLPGSRWPQARLLQQVRQRLEELNVGASRPQAGRIHLTRPSLLGLSGRPHVYLIGLEEGRWLTPQAEDCVLDDQERAELHPELPLSRDLPRAMQFLLLERIDTVAGQLTFSYSWRDRQGGRGQVPSWLFFSNARRHHPELRNYERLFEWLGEPARAVPMIPLEPAAEAALYPNLARAQRAEAARSSSEFGEFDGYVPACAGLWEPGRTGKPVSVSRLTALATCPYRVFLEEGLALRAGAPRLPDPDLWLDPPTRGILLHDILADYQRNLRSQGWRPALERDRVLLRKLLEEHLERLRSLYPPPSLAQQRTESIELRRDLEHYLALELLGSERRPLGLEVPFGIESESASQEPLARAEPVELELSAGDKLAVCGRIDRIDRLADGGLAIVDYKTGRSLQAPAQACYDRGRLLQHAVYALVVEQLAGPVVQSSYFFILPGAARPWVHFGPPARERFLPILERVLEPLRSGAFVHTHESDKDCRFCDFRRACGLRHDASTRAKLANPLNTSLESRRRLLEEQ